MPDDIAEPALRELAHDPDLAVAGAAAEAFAGHDTKNAHETLLDLLFAKDIGVRLSAVTALGAIIEKRLSSGRPRSLAEFQLDLPDYERVFDESHGDIANELKFNVLRNVAKIGGDRATALLVRAQGDDSAYVRAEARRLLVESYEKSNEHPPTAVKISPKPALVPIAGRDFPKYTHDPIVEMKTSRGVLRFELFPAEAPTHVHSFLELAKRGYYDGLTFHRVVADFVIQGGDYRGDGNGGTTFRVKEDVRALFARGENVPSDALRHEIGARKFVRGSLGMPRNDDLDSGGSQFFVTQRETPHLDGRYTIFGELRAGFDVLDRIEIGDTIESVLLVDDGI
jgi:peptidyl-prolyl cis-trans isomerase B (cyclophilin B)